MELDELEAFVNRFKELRAKFGLTQDDIGLALGRRHGTEISQTTVSRFEAMALSYTNMCKLYPVLKAWIDDAEQEFQEGLHALQLIQKIEQRTGNVSWDPSQGPVRKRRKRTNLDEHQKTVLESSYAKEQKPKPKAMHAIARSVGLDPQVVRCWFSNRRQKDRSIMLQQHTDSLDVKEQADEGEVLAQEEQEDEVHALNLITPKAEESA